MLLRVGTWNLDRSGVRGMGRWQGQLRELQRIQCDVWVLSEAHRGQTIPEMHGCFSDPGQPPYKQAEAAVAIWTRSAGRQVQVVDSRLSAAVELQLPQFGPQLLVYGTVIPYKSEGQQQGHAAWSLHRQSVDALIADCSRLRDRYPHHCLVLAGDFNMSLGPRAWYGLQEVKAKLVDGLAALQIYCRTLEDPRDRSIPRGNVDHIFATRDVRREQAVDLWFDRELSDHNGVAFQASLINEARGTDWARGETGAV